MVVGGVQGVWQGVPHPQQLRGQGVAQVGAIAGWHPADTAPWKGWGPRGTARPPKYPAPLVSRFILWHCSRGWEMPATMQPVLPWYGGVSPPEGGCSVP